MWRPNDWNNPHKEREISFMLPESYLPTPLIETHRYFAFEAGADAILKALIDKDSTPTGLPHTAYENHPKGWIVFIPDMER